eukprot:6062525-Amphidinium_carterae.1
MRCDHMANSPRYMWQLARELPHGDLVHTWLPKMMTYDLYDNVNQNNKRVKNPSFYQQVAYNP